VDWLDWDREADWLNDALRMNEQSLEDVAELKTGRRTFRQVSSLQQHTDYLRYLATSCFVCMFVCVCVCVCVCVIPAVSPIYIIYIIYILWAILSVLYYYTSLCCLRWFYNMRWAIQSTCGYCLLLIY